MSLTLLRQWPYLYHVYVYITHDTGHFAFLFTKLMYTSWFVPYLKVAGNYCTDVPRFHWPGYSPTHNELVPQLSWLYVSFNLFNTCTCMSAYKRIYVSRVQYFTIWAPTFKKIRTEPSCLWGPVNGPVNAVCLSHRRIRIHVSPLCHSGFKEKICFFLAHLYIFSIVRSLHDETEW